MNRRGFMGSILAAGMAPAVVGSGILMPLGKVWVPNRSPVMCEWNGYRWSATGGTIFWSRVDDPSCFGSFFNAKELQNTGA